MNDNFEVIANDLRAKFTSQKEGGGFASLELYDADDYDEFIIGEDEMIALYHFLGRKLKSDGLLS